MKSTKHEIRSTKQIQNSNDQNSKLPEFGVLNLSIVSDFDIRVSDFHKRGITLLLVVVILSALFSISLGIFNVTLGQIKISGEIADSFVAFYAADQGIEKMLYRDRTPPGVCSGPDSGPDCFPPQTFDVESGACYTIRVSKIAGITEILASGQYRCGVNPQRVVKRGFLVIY